MTYLVGSGCWRASRHFGTRSLLQRAARLWTGALDRLLQEEPAAQVERCAMSLREPQVSAFLGKQIHIATEQFGKVYPLDLDE